MEMRSEIDASDGFVEEVVLAPRSRPMRPSRPDGAKRSARPMLLSNPIDEASAAPAKSDAPVKMERPTRPVRAEGAERPERVEFVSRPERPRA